MAERLARNSTFPGNLDLDFFNNPTWTTLKCIQISVEKCLHLSATHTHAYHRDKNTRHFVCVRNDRFFISPFDGYVIGADVRPNRRPQLAARIRFFASFRPCKVGHLACEKIGDKQLCRGNWYEIRWFGVFCANAKIARIAARRIG